MKLVIDMNLSTDWAAALQAVSIDAFHWNSIGPSDATDAEIMTWAQANGAVVLTRDLDFASMLIIQRRASPSVIQLRIDQVRPERHLSLVQRALAVYGDQLDAGAIITLEEERMRVRSIDTDSNG